MALHSMRLSPKKCQTHARRSTRSFPERRISAAGLHKTANVLNKVALSVHGRNITRRSTA